jgi:hypothetical protein
MRGAPEAVNTGKIQMNIEQDEVKTVLSADGVQQILRSYSVVGKVLATGLVDYDRLQNQFLISCASMGNQLLRTYDLGLGQDENPVELTPERIAGFFFDILFGRVSVSTISGDFDLASIVKGLAPTLATPAAPDPGAAAAETTGPLSPPPAPPAPPTAEVAAIIEQTPQMPRVTEEAELTQEEKPRAEGEPDVPLGSEQIQQEPPVQSDQATQGLCRHCGAEVEEGGSFCGNCGQPLT